MLVARVCQRWITGSEVECWHTECREARHIGPAELGTRRLADRAHEIGGRLPVKPGHRRRSRVHHLDVESVEHVLDMCDGLIKAAVGCEPVVDRHDARIRDDIARHPAADPDGIETFAVFETVDNGPTRNVRAKPVEDPAGRVDRVGTQPRTRTVCTTAGRGDRDSQRALAASLDPGIGWLHQDRQIRLKEFRMVVGELLQAVEARLDLLALVEHVRDIAHRGLDGRCERQGNGDAALHVAGTQPEQQPALNPMREIPVLGHRVEMPADEHPLSSALRGARDDRVAVPCHRQVRDGGQGALHRVGEWALVSRLARYVDEGHGQVHCARREVQSGVHGHAATVAA